MMRARRRYGCAPGRVQFAVIGEARFYIKVAPQYSRKVAGPLRRRTRCTRRHPVFDRLIGRFGRARSRLTIRPRRPAPGDQSVVANMQRAISLKLRSPLRAGSLIRVQISAEDLPNQTISAGATRQFLAPGRPVQCVGIAGEMASRAAQAGIAEARSVSTALDVEGVHARAAMMRTGPARPIIRNMTVGTARIREHRMDLAPFGQAFCCVGCRRRRCLAVLCSCERCRENERGSRRQHDEELLPAKAIVFESGGVRMRLPVSAHSSGMSGSASMPNDCPSTVRRMGIPYVVVHGPGE